MKKRIFSIVLMLALLITMLPARLVAVAEKAESKNEGTPVLMLNADASSKKNVKLTWNKVEGADKYVVYGNSCGSKELKKLTEVTKAKYTVKSIKKKKLEAKEFYRFRVEAYRGSELIVKSPTIHVITGNVKGKYGNVKSIKADKKALELEIGASETVTATTKIYKNKKHLPKSHGKSLHYYSNNEAVAKVNSKGKVTAKAEGEATIYIVDVGGKYAEVKVTVKGKEPEPTATPKPTATPTATPDPAATPTITPTPTATPTATPTPAPVYNVTFDGNGDDNKFSETIKETFGEAYVLPATVPVKKGWQLTGWNTDKDGKGEEITDATIVELSADATVFAQWKEKTLKATFVNGKLTLYYDIYDHANENPYADPVPAKGKFEGPTADNWPWAADRAKITAIEIDSSVKEYDGFTSLDGMFIYCSKAASLEGFEYLNVSNVTSLMGTFFLVGGEVENFNAVPDVAGWDTSSVTNMSATFASYGTTANYIAYDDDLLPLADGSGSKSLNKAPDVSNWDVSNVKNMNAMFSCYGAYSTVLNVVPDVSKWKTNALVSATSLFECYGASSAKLTSMPAVSGFNTSKLENFNGFLGGYGYTSKELEVKLDLRNWDLSALQVSGHEFTVCGHNGKVWDVKIPVKSVVDTKGTVKRNTPQQWFFGTADDDYIGSCCDDHLFTVPSLKATITDDGVFTLYYDTKDHTGEGTLYTNVSTNESSFNDRPWYSDSKIGSVKKIVIDSSLDGYDGFTSLAGMFAYANIAEEYIGFEYLDTSNVTNIEAMFNLSSSDAVKVTQVPDVSKWNTEKVQNMGGVFNCFGSNCSLISAVPDVTGWNVKSVTKTAYLFCNYGAFSAVLNFELDLSNWDLSRVIDYSYMFDYAGDLTATWKVTIPAKTGSASNEAGKWYCGANGDYIEPTSSKSFTVSVQ